MLRNDNTDSLSNNIDTLPLELLLKILSNLSLKDLVLSLNINHLFNSIGKDDALWKQRFEHHFPLHSLNEKNSNTFYEKFLNGMCQGK